MNDNAYSLKDKPFNTELNKTIPEVIDKYVGLILEYYTFIGEKQNIVHTKKYPYILTRGLDTITHVFSMILFYTKNLELTYYHSQKSFYFYVEFIEQIIDVQNTFLHLSSRDATIFVYKKTIYEINSDCRKEIENNEQTDEQFKKINAYLQLYKQVPHNKITESHTILMERDLTTQQLEQLCLLFFTSDFEFEDMNEIINTLD